MDSELANKVFCNPLIFAKIAGNLWYRYKLPLRLVSKGLNEQVLSLVKSGSFCPVLYINRRHLQDLQIADINEDFCTYILINEYNFNWKDGGKEKEALKEFFLVFQEKVEKMRFQFTTRLGIYIFEHIWNNYKLPSLKEVELWMDNITVASELEVNFSSKESVIKLTTYYKDSALNSFIKKFLNATPCLQELRIGGNNLPDLRKLNLPNLKTFVWGGLDLDVQRGPAALALLTRTVGGWSRSLERLEVYFPLSYEHVPLIFVLEERMEKLRMLGACGVQIWGSLTEEKLPVLEEIYLHSAIPHFEGASKVDAGLRRILKKWEEERSVLNSVKKVTLCHNLHPDIVSGLLKLFPQTERLKIDCTGCWKIGRGDDSWFSSAGIVPRFGRGNVEGLFPREFMAWLELLKKVEELKNLRNLTCYFYIARRFVSFDESGETPEDYMKQQARLFMSMISKGLETLHLIQHRGSHEAGLCLRDRTSRLMSLVAVVASSSKMKAMTLAEFGLHPGNVQDLKEFIKRKKLPVHFVNTERLGQAPI